MKEVFIRTCQECGHEQPSKDPATYKDDKWEYIKCKKCKSEALDYGSFRRIPESKEDEEQLRKECEEWFKDDDKELT
ncbi:MAG TPA: hypothetical protein VL854_11900 [Nitrososphaeraceae archaeon]|nr:hypothetical protein [Nitrososphaeraceae archaeon]